MTAIFNAEEILAITEGRLSRGLMPVESGCICTDTRQIGEMSWYLALAGARFDGHDFLGDAFAAGAIGAIVEERGQYALGNQQFPLISVENTLNAYQKLARNWRKRIHPHVIAITGSSGKTTTKELCASVLAQKYRCHFSQANENNEIGVPKTLLAMPDDTQSCIVEMGMRGLNQIAPLAACSLPDIGIITNVGVAHIELLGSQENIARAKCEMLEYMEPKSAVAIIGNPSAVLMSCVSQVFGGKVLSCNEDELDIVEVRPELTLFRVKGSGQVFVAPLHGRPLLEDAWCVIRAAQLLGMPDRDIAAGLLNFVPLKGRGTKYLTTGGAQIIDETYNANPDSVRASILGILEASADTYRRKIVVLGDMAELGEHTESLMYELGTWLATKNIQKLITVGAVARLVLNGIAKPVFDTVACANLDDAAACLLPELRAGTGILVKGSRSAGLEKLIAKLISDNELKNRNLK